MQNTAETPPPLAPLAIEESFQTTSPMLPFGSTGTLVPPTAVTNGDVAGKSALSRALLPPSPRQPVEPLSPDAARIVWPCAAAFWKTVSSAFRKLTPASASQPP